jgi:hypothetical protein
MGSNERLQERLPTADKTAATLLPDRVPVIHGDADDGVDYLCGSCGAVIAERGGSNQFFDFGVICARCNALVGFPELPAGRPLPPGKTVVLNDGKYRLSGVLQSSSDVVVAGEEAVRRLLRQKGDAADVRSGDATLDERYLREMVTEAKGLSVSVMRRLPRAICVGSSRPRRRRILIGSWS